jgi:hypothetical protein
MNEGRGLNNEKVKAQKSQVPEFSCGAIIASVMERDDRSLGLTSICEQKKMVIPKLMAHSLTTFLISLQVDDALPKK